MNNYAPIIARVFLTSSLTRSFFINIKMPKLIPVTVRNLNTAIIIVIKRSDNDVTGNTLAVLNISLNAKNTYQ